MAVDGDRFAICATRRAYTVPFEHALIELYNRDHLAVVYGEDFAVAALHALQRQVRGWGGAIAAVDAKRFLVTLPRQKREGSGDAPGVIKQLLIQHWQLALSAAPFVRADQRALLVVGVDRVTSCAGQKYLDGGLAQLQEVECQGRWVPVLAPPQCGWAWRLGYEVDMETALVFHRALLQGRASLVFQPIVCGRRLVTGPNTPPERASLPEPLYQEALLRLSMRDDEPDLRPGDLVAVLERLGLVRLLDQAVLSAVIDRLEAQPGLRLGCNLSAMSLAPDEGWWRGLLERLQAQPVVATRLTLEITETAALPDFERAVDLAKQLKALGCQIAIDDLGCGHTRLDFIREVGPSIIKISGEWVEAASISRSATDQLQRLGALAATFAPVVIAEGVGTQEHLAAAYVAGIDWMQGRAVAEHVQPRPPVVLELPCGASIGR